MKSQTMPTKKKSISPQRLWETLSVTFVNFVESIFYTLGLIVASYPRRTIFLAVAVVILSSIGMLKFHMEKNPMKLWVPPESDFYHDTNWYIDKFGTAFRIQKILIVADDVLQPDILLTLYNLTTQVNSIEIEINDTQYSINDLCYKVPIVNSYISEKSDNDFSDPTLWIDDDFYCNFLDSFSMACLQYNVLDLWKNNLDAIKNTTKYEIITNINKIKSNPSTGHPIDYTKLLGGTEVNESGDVMSAKSILFSVYTAVNMTAVDLNEVGNLMGTEDWVSVPLAKWETEFLNLMKNVSEKAKNVSIYYEAGRSFGDISGQAMFQDLDKLSIGIALMFMYIVFGLSRCNWLEIKLTLASVGLMSVGMAYISAVSWCSILNIDFGPVHSSLPFLLMGLGVDDMFVMNACWNNLSPSDSKKTLPVKIGLMLKHAGVSIVITSFTDIVALLIGAYTILPSLKSFCFYAAMGVFFIFCYTVTFYVAVFTLDIKRMTANRDGIITCYQHKNTIRVSEDQTIFQKMSARFYKNIVFSFPGKVIVALFTIVMAGFSIQGILKLEQRFDPKWFIPEKTYFKDFLNNYEHLYPNNGEQGMIFLGEMDYNKEFLNLYNMTKKIRNESYIQSLDNWVESLNSYVEKNYNRKLTNTSVTNEEFSGYLSRFLYSPVGGRFQINFRFSPPFRCGDPATKIEASSISFKFTKFNGPEEYIPAMNEVKYLVKSTNISTGDGFRSVWSKVFANWVTDEIISVEVERNVELALLCVMLCTVVLITNLQMCFWIFLCVLLTIVNVLGWMQRWGMTVDITCCIGLELAIGLCVDYAAHVGHTFLTILDGTRAERAFKTVTTIGNAVLLGGGSTFLSLSILGLSETYTFKAFFKIFFLVILFGLFNGLVFLPVVLSLVGPGAYKVSHEKEMTAETVELKDNKENAIDKQVDDG